jgi:hypothetical protein
MAIDINHPGYAAAMGLAGSGFTARPTAPPLDVESLLRNSPYLQGQFRQIGYGLTDEAGNLKPLGYGALGGVLAPYENQYQADLIRYGGIPTGVQVSDTTRQLAEDASRSGFSELAQLQRGYRTNTAAGTTALAGRGLGFSGGIGQHMMRSLQDYDIDRATAEENLRARLTGYRSQQGAAVQSAQGQAQTAIQNALQLLSQQIQTGQIANPAGPGIGTLPATPKPQAAPFRTNPNTFRPVSSGIRAYGTTPTNRIGLIPGGGRVPIGAPSLAPTRSGYGTPGQRALY